MPAMVRVFRGAPAPMVLALLLSLLPGPVAHAASCNGASHHIALSGGGANPSSGTTSTTFTFKVTYSSNAGCAPTFVRVTVSGVGTYAMSGTGTSYATGVAYQRTMALPAGTRGYSFSAGSGSGAGADTATFTNVHPSKVSVQAPTPKPKPTAKPTPKPTAQPTPPPTAQPTAKSTPRPTRKPSPRSTRSPRPHRSAAESATATASPTPGATPLAGIITSPPGRGDGEATPSHPLPVGPLRLAGWLLAVLLWIAATGGGLALFLYLARSGGSAPLTVAGAVAGDRGPVPATAGATGGASPAVSSRARINTDESQLPRWLRPSVQAARHARPERE